MKVKNMVFSGFAAAMFAGVMGNADAATYNLASKNYVDAQVDKVEAEVENKQDKLAAGAGVTIGDVDGVLTIDTKPVQINGEDKPIDEVVQDVTDAIGDTSRLPEDASIIDVVADVQDTIGDITNELGQTSTVENVLAEKENVSNKVTVATADDISEMDTAEKQSKYPSIAVAQTIADAAVTKVNEVAGDLSTLQTQVSNNTADILSINESEVMKSGISSELVGKITANEAAIGDETDGLVKDVADLRSADTVIIGRVDGLEANVGDTSVATQIDNKIAALDLANTYDAKGAAEDVQEAVTAAKYVSAQDATEGGYLVKVDGQGNVSMVEVAIVNEDGTSDMITGSALGTDTVTVD